MMSSRVLAAGAIVWRRNDSDELEVALIHRPKYDDWSFPKGKLEVNEIAISMGGKVHENPSVVGYE